ncbi:MAG: GrdX family protein [Defluviitaleaceae bacterium]|nr:GrdX family protein [Defluviitaleaceae bacterium]MCL2216831.1 GrdX family protein [Defluviitaleaceae bacterium]
MIFSNNPVVSDKYPKLTRLADSDVHGVFAAVRDAVHKGARLVSHPLSGSVKPNESPYKSVAVDIVTGEWALDFKSLQIIEDAITTLAKLPRKHREYTAQMLEDFRVIDLDLIESAL